MKEDYTLPTDFEAEVKQKIIEIEDYYRLYRYKDEKTVKLIKQAEEFAEKITDEKAKNNALASIYSMSVLHEEYITDKAIKNTESGENAKVICYNLINDALSIKDENERLKFIDEIALPRIRVMDYSDGIASLLYWKSYSLVQLKRYNEAKVCINEGSYFLGCTRGLPRHEENKYYSVLPLRYLQKLCGCLFDPRWKAGFTEDREYELYYEKLTAHIEVEDGGIVMVKAGTFENCLKVTVTSEKNGELEKNKRYYWWSYAFCGKKTFYFAPNVGVVRHECDWGNGDLVSVCDLSEYTSTATAGEYMPVYIGCSWVYDETTIEDAYILRKVYRITHGMNRKFFLTTDQDFTYCGTESEYNTMRSVDK